jgi:dTDP-4-amino-4,6-dideoxygalactose transaminase
MTTLTDRHRGHADSYDVIELSYNYRIDEIRSALGLVQLKKLENNNSKRKAWTERYWKLLESAGVEFPFQGKSGSPSYHIFPILLPPEIERKSFIDTLRIEGIQTSIHYPSTHSFSYYQSRFGKLVLPRTDDISQRQVTLPLYPGMGAERVDLVSACVRKALSKL